MRLQASVTGLDEKAVSECMDRFCKPDPNSRSQDCGGARLELISPPRLWGWRIVNHGKYREKARLQSKAAREVSEGVNAKRMHDRRGPPVTASDPLSNININNTKKVAKAPRPKGSKKAPDDFTPDRQFAITELPDLDVDREIAKFRDWEFKTPRSDWNAVWRTWIRNARDRKSYSKQPGADLSWR